MVSKFALVPRRIVAANDGPLKLDLGCGTVKDDGFIGIDRIAGEGVDYVLDLRQTPWPVDDASVDFIRAVYLLPFFTGGERIAFMEECYRVLRDNAQMQIVVPRYDHTKAIQDPLFKWPPFCETSFCYFNKGFRETNKCPHDINCDFDFGYGFGFEDEMAVRSEEHRNFAVKHYNNAVADLHVTMTKRSGAGANTQQVNL